MTLLTGQQVADAGLDGWAFLPAGLQTRIPVPDFATGLALVTAIGAAAEAADHHPALDLRYRHLDVTLTSHDEHGVTGRDVRLARTITGLAAEAGVTPGVDGVTGLEFGLDSPDHAAIADVWRAAFGLPQRPGGRDDEIEDPHGRLPSVWFQASGSSEPRQRWHPDIWVDPSQVEARIAAVVAAGGAVISADEAPSFWVLADSQGNRCCLCTWQGRERPG